MKKLFNREFYRFTVRFATIVGISFLTLSLVGAYKLVSSSKGGDIGEEFNLGGDIKN